MQWCRKLNLHYCLLLFITLIVLRVDVCCLNKLVSFIQQVVETLSGSSGLVQELQTRWQTWVWSIQGLPQYVLHQLVSLFFYISQMYNLGCLPPQNGQPNKDRGSLNGEMSPLNEGVQRQPQASPATSRMRKPNKMPVWDKRCHVKGCISR